VAQLVIEGSDLVVRLSLMEKVGAFHPDVRVPLATVRAVRVAVDPWTELRGLRAPGTGVPSAISLGTRRGSGVRDFAAVYSHTPAVVIDAAGADFDRLVISSSQARVDAERIATSVRAGSAEGVVPAPGRRAPRTSS
jgi:uncharacterized protein